MKNNLLSDKLAYNGDTKTRTHLHLCSYTVDRVEEASGDDFEEMKSRFQPDGITWLQIHGLEDTDAVQTVCTHFGIDFLVMQDILNTDHASKVEEHGSVQCDYCQADYGWRSDAGQSGAGR